MLLEWIEGQWYFAVSCKQCGWQFPFAKAADKLSECAVEIVCIECKVSGFYCPKEITRVQAD